MSGWTEAEIVEIAARLRTARLAAGFEKAADAVRKFGWAYSRYMNYENAERAIPPKQAAIFSAAFGVSVDFLYFGEAALKNRQSSAPMLTFTVRNIPLLRLANTADLNRVASGFEPMHAEMIPVPETAKLPERCIFIQVQDKSMSNAAEPITFEPGDKVMVDLDAAPSPSDFVLALVMSEKSALFRRYREVGIANGETVADLVPLNTDFRTIRCDASHPATIVGVCRQIHSIRDI
jgi:SOS-response transcriptional repressor LexA